MKTKYQIICCTLTAVILAFAGSADAANCPTSLSNPDRSVDSVPLQKIPLKIYRSFLVIAEGQIGGVSVRQNFILDTGTAPSIINERLVRQLKLGTGPSTIIAAGKTVTVQAAIVPEIDLGPIHAASLPMNVQDLSQAERDFGVAIAGIIGLDLLSRSSFHLDYDKKRIEFGDTAHDGIPVHFDARARLAVAEVSLGGRTVRMLVDTGTDSVVLFAGNFAKVDWLNPRDTSQFGTNVVGRDSHVQVFSARDLVFGGQHFTKYGAYLVPGGTSQFDGLLGVRALGFRGVSYDQACETLYLQK